MNNLVKRTNITASRLGSYFGKGFNTPEKQLEYDLGIDEPFFTETAQARMDMGTYFEDKILDLFEDQLNLSIDDRNSGVVDALDGLLRVKVDGMTIYNGEPCVVECKFSNDKSGSFIDNEGYILQLKAGMIAKGVRQGLLLGLYMGLPQYKLVLLNDKDERDIKDMVAYIGAILNGFTDDRTIPYHIIDSMFPPIYMEGESKVDFDEESVPTLEHVISLKQTIKELTEEVKVHEEYLKKVFPITSWTDGKISLAIANQERAGTLDMNELKSAYPEIDFDSFRKEPTIFKVIRLRALKGGD